MRENGAKLNVIIDDVEELRQIRTSLIENQNLDGMTK